MNLYEKIIDDFSRDAVEIAKEEIKPLNDFFETFAEYVVSTKAVIKTFKETGEVDFDDISWEKFQEKKASAASGEGSQKEKLPDVPIIAEIKQEAPATRRTTRRTAKNAEKTALPIVKLEKIDEATKMPAPKKRAPRKKAIKQEKDEDVPDVAIVEEPIPVIVLDDSTEEDNRKTSQVVQSVPENASATAENKSDDQKIENAEEDIVNATFVSKPSAKTLASVSELMTDDESEGEAAAAVPVKPSVRPKQVFSAYEHSPVKAKVQQFEKLHEAATRSTTRSQVTDKVTTPTFFKTIPKAASTAMKSASIENLRRKQEREESAKKNRDRRLLETAEKNKRIREEKQLKAQQQREAIEREKMRLLEQQKAKEEERKKRQLEAKDRPKVGDEKKKKLNDRPLYLLYKPPRLPTDDCYDSDEEEAGAAANATRVIPNWVNKSQIRAALRTQFFAGHQIKNTFFSIQAESPDLQEILEVVDSKKLVRHSSAVWTRPPRFTMFPVLEKEGGYDNYYADY